MLVVGTVVLPVLGVVRGLVVFMRLSECLSVGGVPEPRLSCPQSVVHSVGLQTLPSFGDVRVSVNCVSCERQYSVETGVVSGLNLT